MNNTIPLQPGFHLQLLWRHPFPLIDMAFIDNQIYSLLPTSYPSIYRLEEGEPARVKKVRIPLNTQNTHIDTEEYIRLIIMKLSPRGEFISRVERDIWFSSTNWVLRDDELIFMSPLEVIEGDIHIL